MNDENTIFKGRETAGILKLCLGTSPPRFWHLLGVPVSEQTRRLQGKVPISSARTPAPARSANNP